MLSSYLRNRPLTVLRSVENINGFEVWRKLTSELEPSSRSRSLAMAQALVGFPAMSKGASLMDCVLTFEKLVSEYEKKSSTKHDDNLEAGTLLKGIPQSLKQHIMVDISEKTTYAELRTKLLQYERSNPDMVSRKHIGIFKRAGSDLARKHQGISWTDSNGVGQSLLPVWKRRQGKRRQRKRWKR